MYLKRLDIRDFGILQEQSLKQLNSGLVVIGGLNRAGKTTTLELLRYLGYGFPRDNSIPPAKNKYNVQADYNYQGEEYNLSLEGYSNPKVNKVNGGAAENIYSNLSEYTYQQLFTISLSKLYQLPTKPKNQRKLQSILLGAGLSDILDIQDLKSNLKSKAEAIGGKNGKADVYQFKEANQQIQEGVELRQEAKSQLNQYKSLEEELTNVKGKIGEQQETIAELKAKVTILDVLKNSYQQWEDKIKLEFELDKYDYDLEETKYDQTSLQQALDLKDRYLNLREDIKQKRNQFRRVINSSQVELLQEKLIKNKDQLKDINLHLSGLEARIKNYWQRKKELKEQKDKITNQLKQENDSWQSFSIVDSITIDAEIEDELEQKIEQWHQLTDKYSREEESLTNLKEEKERIKSQLDARENPNFALELRNYYWWSLGFVAVGILAFILNLWLGILLSLVGVIGAGINYISNYLLASNQFSQQQELESKLKAVEEQIQSKEQNLAKLKQKKELLETDLDNYRKKLKLSKQTSVRLIRSRFAVVKDFKFKIEQLSNKKANLNKLKEELEQELKEIIALIKQFPKQGLLNDLSDDDNNLIKHSQEIIAAYQELYNCLDLGIDLKAIQVEKKNLTAEIKELVSGDLKEEQVLSNLDQFINNCHRYSKFKDLNEELNKLNVQLESKIKTNRVKEAVQTSQQLNYNSDLLSLFKSLFRHYTSSSELKEKYKQSIEKLKLAEDDLEELKDKQNTIKKKKNDLSSSDKLKQAQKKINQGRSSLGPLAEKFAINRAAAFILDKVQQRFIAKVKSDMLAPASNILAKITAGDYQQILPQDNLSVVDYKLESDNNVEDTIFNLSRGTYEQLFLAVRLSRIKEITPKLPVIIDDSLVNFDLFHQQQVIELLGELAQEQQIFILTCHPHLIDLIKRQNSKAQYWQLKQGEFEFSKADKLIDHLSV